MYKLPSEKLGLRIIFGNLSLLGISYQGKQKDEEYKKKFSNKNEMRKVIKNAIRYGIKIFSACPHYFNETLPISAICRFISSANLLVEPIIHKNR